MPAPSTKGEVRQLDPAYLEKLRQQHEWADSVLRTMTDEQKIGQLFMVAAYSNRDESHYREIDRLVSQYHIGGLIFFQGGPVRQALLTNRYQRLAKIPLLISIDGEWGLGMRLDSTISFPKAMTLGAIGDNKLIYDMGAEIARQLKRMGIHINFAPVADVNVNPANPVIGIRSFGENKEKVAEKALSYMRGMQQNGIIANAKHFPGHGDTDTDSHYALPIIKHDRRRIEEVELYPFRKLIQDSVMSIMVAHINLPAYDADPKKPTTLSQAVVTDLLRYQLGFQGLIFTDALNMKGVSANYSPGETDLLALKAGNDCLLFPLDVPKGVAKIKEAIAAGEISMAEIERRVKKILMAKYFAGLHQYKPIPIPNLIEDLNTPQAKALRMKLYEQAVTVVRNADSLIPFKNLEELSFASVVIGAKQNNDFQRILGKYAPFEHYQIADKTAGDATYDALLPKLKNKKVVIVGLLGVSTTNRIENDFGISQASRNFIKKLSEYTKVIPVVFGNPYSLKFFDDASYLVCAYENNSDVQIVVPQVLFGAVTTNARLPVSVSPNIQAGAGCSIFSLNRLKYTFLPEQEHMSSYILDKIDSIVNQAIASHAMPGCQILVARNGNVVFNRNYGHLTYEPSAALVDDETVYDLASLTKVTATMQAVMYLHDRGLLDINKKVADYLPELQGTNKADLILRDILLHQAGLIQRVPHWWHTMEKGKYKPEYYSSQMTEQHTIPVDENLYASAKIHAEVWKWLRESPLRSNKASNGLYGYFYSDVPFYLLKQIVEQQTGQCLDQFVEQYFYRPLGLSTMGYLPLNRIEKSRIAPTEEDKYFRKKRIQGVVHDPDAALQGGVAGHAGVFSNANDVAILMQMNLQNGYYGGKKFFNQAQTVPFFTEKRTVPHNRRGLGWDKPIRGSGGPTSAYCSPATYGHNGFTGVGVWVDPQYNLVYVFLSNRTYPNARNWRLIEQNIRVKVQDQIYLSMGVTRHYLERESH
ncbi:MAG: glycoside hydrolase family 3 N-terminal domain-containing protein [Cytophagales bacterium]|nr:serine hydrolase [Bernardetiaceae bacterium]MDW8204323.1 glycoside hydrolase family 3 N-terminal domain-containing protein [Cytophagales bacterium]